MDDEDDDGGLWFDEAWIDWEPFHKYVTEAVAKVIMERSLDANPERIKMTGELLYHFTSHWFLVIRQAEGQLVSSAVSACHAFTLHCIQAHGIHESNQLDLLQLLTRFCALVITKHGETPIQ